MPRGLSIQKHKFFIFAMSKQRDKFKQENPRNISDGNRKRKLKPVKKQKYRNYAYADFDEEE